MDVSQTDATSLSNLKDIIAIVTGIIGAVLGTLGFVRSLSVDRRVSIEPAFKNLWSEIEPALTRYIDRSLNQITHIEAVLQKQQKPEQISKVENPPDLKLDDQSWKYDSKLLRRIRNTVGSIHELSLSIKQYNNLRYPTTSDFITLIQLDHAKAATNSLAQATFVKYFGDLDHTVGELKKLYAYQADLSMRYGEVRWNASLSRSLIEKLSERVDFCNRRFADNQRDGRSSAT